MFCIAQKSPHLVCRVENLFELILLLKLRCELLVRLLWAINFKWRGIYAEMPTSACTMSNNSYSVATCVTQWQLKMTIRRHRNVVTAANHLHNSIANIEQINNCICCAMKWCVCECKTALYTIIWPLMPIYLSLRLLSHLANRA